MFSRRHKGWIGVDLGTSAVKLAQVERVRRTGHHPDDGRGGWSWRLAHARVIRRPAAGPGHTDGDDVLDWWNQICTGQRLREGFSGRRTACVLPTARVDLRTMNLPEGTEAERRAMIGNELEGLSDKDAGRAVFDFWDTRPPEQSKLEHVSVLSAPEDEALAVVASLARAGLSCRVIDGLPLAIARAVSMTNDSGGRDAGSGGRDAGDEARGDGTHLPPPTTHHESPAVGALDWGAASATFSILWDGRPVFTRQFRDCGFAAMPAAVSQALGLSIGDAEQLLCTHGVRDPAEREDPLRDVQEVITDVTGGLVSEIVSQLNKTLSYPELHRSGLVPAKIWLLGGGATVKNLAALLSARIQRTVETWHLPSTSGEVASGGWRVAGVGENVTGDGGLATLPPATRHPAPATHDPPPSMLAPAIALSALAFV